MDRCRIVGAFDTETTNVKDLIGCVAFPILYQFGRLYCPIEELTPESAYDNVEVSIARCEQEIYKCFDAEIERANGYVPVILVHNLGFDMYALAPYLLAHDVRVLAKTAKKPISFQVLDAEGKPALIFLDTLGLYMKSLKTLGDECGMLKAVGDWDYMLTRTPETPLTAHEIGYAKQDIYTLLCYTAYFLRLNPDIRPDDIGNRIQTKTGVVRAKRLVNVGNVKGRNARQSVRQYWHLLNQSQRPKSDDELFTMHAATRGGFTFCSRENASRVFHAGNGLLLQSYDSTSQHPAQMVSHLYPQDFRLAELGQLKVAFDICAAVTLDRVLDYWIKPFPYAFYAAFAFVNLRPREGSIFEREGIFPLASARITGNAPVFDNQASAEFKDAAYARGYGDTATQAQVAFGKLESARSCTLYLTELDAWIVSRCYVWDSVEPVSGYITSKFRKPPDMAVLSVMRYYAAKDALKGFMETYKNGRVNDVKRIRNYYPDSFVSKCERGTADYAELREYYMLSKADLNALFGIEATNECRRDYELSELGIELVGEDGLHNMPKQTKCFYQFGQRIVGWSRVAQVAIMELIASHVENIICGDTDSIKIAFKECNKGRIDDALARHAKALDKAKQAATIRARKAYSALYNPLVGIGHYVFDGGYDAFSASWNKSYIALVKGTCKLTIAGVPTSRRSVGAHDSYNDFCDALMAQGWTFDEVASLVIGYNVTIDESITKLNARIHPKFGDFVDMRVRDYLGAECDVHAPAALALFPNVKTLGDTGASAENAANLEHAIRNNPNVNYLPVWVKWRDGKPVIER